MFFRMDLRIHICVLPSVARFLYYFSHFKNVDNYRLALVRHFNRRSAWYFFKYQFLNLPLTTLSSPLLIPNTLSINGNRRNSYLLHDIQLVKLITKPGLPSQALPLNVNCLLGSVVCSIYVQIPLSVPSDKPKFLYDLADA